MSIPLPVLLARMANLLESARLAAESGAAEAAALHIEKAQEVLEVARDA